MRIPWIYEKRKLLLRMAVSAALLAILVRYVDLGEARKALAGMAPAWLLPVLLVCLLDRILMAWKWGILLKVVSIRIGAKELFKIYYISNFLGFAFPFGVGPDIVRLLRIRNHPRSDVLSSIVVERFLGIVASAVVALAGLGLFLRLARETAPAGPLAVTIAGFAAAGLVAAFLLFARMPRTERRAVPSPAEGGWRGLREKSGASLNRYRGRWGPLAGFLLLSILEQLMPVIGAFFLARAMSLPLSAAECFAFVPLGMFLQRLPVSFLGIGVREGSYVFLLGFLGIGYTSALMFGVMDLVMDVLFLVPAALWWLTDDSGIAGSAGEREPEGNEKGAAYGG